MNKDTDIPAPFDKSTDYLFQLDHLSTLGVQGDKNRDFLQGQLTCDLREVSPTVMRQGALCNLQGRVVALMDVLQQDTTLYMVLPTALLSTVQKTLSKVALLSRVSLAPVTYTLYGVWPQNPQTNVPLLDKKNLLPYESHQADWGYCYALPNHFIIYLIKPDAEQTLNALFSVEQRYSAQMWHLLQLQHKNIHIARESSELFLPHRMNLHTSGHIHFQKGCYKGQEIIARMHYRSKQKHEVVLFTMPTQPTLGQKIVDEHHQEMGEIMDACEIGKGQYLIAASILLVRSNELFVGDGVRIVANVSSHDDFPTLSE